MRTRYIYSLSVVLFWVGSLSAQFDECYDVVDYELNPIDVYDSLIGNSIIKTTILDVAHEDSIVGMEIYELDTLCRIGLRYSYNGCKFPSTYELNNIHVYNYSRNLHFAVLSYSGNQGLLDSVELEVLMASGKKLRLCIFTNVYGLPEPERKRLLETSVDFKETNHRINTEADNYKSNCVLILKELEQ